MKPTIKEQIKLLIESGIMESLFKGFVDYSYEGRKYLCKSEMHAASKNFQEELLGLLEE
jgi:hypothetical protein